MPALFDPTPQQTDDLIQAVAADYDASLRDVAERFNTTLELLTLWLARPDIESRLAALESACARRARLQAANNLSTAVETLRCVLIEHRDQFYNGLAENMNPRTLELRRRTAETARRAASLLLRLANFTPGPKPSRPRTLPPSTPAAPPTTTSPPGRDGAGPSPLRPSPQPITPTAQSDDASRPVPDPRQPTEHPVDPHQPPSSSPSCPAPSDRAAPSPRARPPSVSPFPPSPSRRLAVPLPLLPRSPPAHHEAAHLSRADSADPANSR